MKIRTLSSATFVQTSITKVTASARNTEHAFMSNGFLNWKKTLLTFKDHQTSESHNLLLSVRLFSKKTNLSNSNAQNIRTQNHHCLAKIIKTLQYLVRHKCRGKCYDGASTMFGKKTGVVTTILEGQSEKLSNTLSRSFLKLGLSGCCEIL